jgi:transposase InsO family protein
VTLCRVLRVGRAGFYAWRGREESQRATVDRRLTVEVRALFAESKGTYGSPRIHGALRTAGIPICRHRIAKLMRKEGLCARPRRKYVVTTDSSHEQPIAPNLLARDFTATAPNRIWAGDVTYLPTREGWLYFAVLLDLFSRRVVGWAFSERNDERLTLSALRLAVDQRRPPRGLVHHSDRGATYASSAYQDELRRRGFVCSMSRKGDCWDNAVVESFFSTLDIESAGGEPFATRAAARKAVTEYVLGFYNPTRLHSYLGYTSPMDFERAA